MRKARINHRAFTAAAPNLSEKTTREGAIFNGRDGAINALFHYLSAYREAAAAAGARGAAGGEPGSGRRRRVHTPNTFPLKRRGTEGVKKI